MARKYGLTLGALFSQLTERILSPEFAADVRHAEFPQAFTRKRKLSLPRLIGALLSMRGQSQQVMLARVRHEAL
jgi:hypothetical protein